MKGIFIHHIRKSKNGIFEQWDKYEKTVPDHKAVEILRNLNKIHHKVDSVDFALTVK